MSRKAKLIERLKAMPKDFTYPELLSLMQLLGCLVSEAGATSGSAIIFILPNGNKFRMHRPHPGNIVKRYVLVRLVDTLKKEGLI